MGAPPSPPPPQRGGQRHAEPRSSPRTGRTALLLAAGLLGMGAALALALLLVWLPPGGTGYSGQAPSSGGDTRSAVADAASTGAVVEATEVTATPSRGEPTDAAPSSSPSSPSSAAAGAGTAVPAVTASATPTMPTPTVGPTAVEITCADAWNNVAGEVCVHTTPGAAITITVTYCNGRQAHNTDLQGTRYADGDGNYTWTWVPETTCPGTAIAHVTASGTGGSADAAATVPVNP